jgi:UDP-N-acetylglucosamine 2-epimerase (non-hydrolysing)
LEIGERAPVVCVGAALRWAEGLLQQRNPDLVLTCGESDAALGAAFAASLAGVAVAHLDAGLVGDPSSPNGRLLDQAATFLLVPHVGALQRLAALGMEDCAYSCGDTLADGLTTAAAPAAGADRFCLCYLERDALESRALPELFAALERIGRPVLLPAAARAQARLAALNIVGRKDLRIIEPLDYLPMQQAVAGAALVITDSPTLQREAYLHAVVALGLSPADFPEAERSGWLRPVALEQQAIIEAAQAAPPASPPDIEMHRGAGLRAAAFLTGL